MKHLAVFLIPALIFLNGCAFFGKSKPNVDEELAAAPLSAGAPEVDPGDPQKSFDQEVVQAESSDSSSSSSS